MTFADYLTKVLVYYTQRSVRLGQAYFSVLEEVRPDVAASVRGSFADPFYDDRKIPMYLSWVGNAWDTEHTMVDLHA